VKIDEAGAGDLGLADPRRIRQFQSSSSASRRGLRFSDRASCIARLQEKSPCAACFGRSMWIVVSASAGATLCSAARIKSARWDFRS
jgi:hypothetical protein